MCFYCGLYGHKIKIYTVYVENARLRVYSHRCSSVRLYMYLHTQNANISMLTC